MKSSNAEVFPGDEDLIEQALPLLPEIGKLLYLSLMRQPGTAGLSLPQVKALGYLGTHGRCSVGELATGLGASMPSASELVDRLVERGLVEREVNPRDRRQVLVGPTAAAGEVHAELKAMRTAQLRRAMSRLAAEERPVFVRSLAALVAGLRCVSEDRESVVADGDVTAVGEANAPPMRTATSEGDSQPPAAKPVDPIDGTRTRRGGLTAR